MAPHRSLERKGDAVQGLNKIARWKRRSLESELVGSAQGHRQTEERPRFLEGVLLVLSVTEGVILWLNARRVDELAESSDGTLERQL